jgi:hypothetical protein
MGKLPKKSKKKKPAKTTGERKDIEYEYMYDHNPEVTIRLRNQSKKKPNEINKANDVEDK